VFIEGFITKMSYVCGHERNGIELVLTVPATVTAAILIAGSAFELFSVHDFFLGGLAVGPVAVSAQSHSPLIHIRFPSLPSKI
jgi:hypothetical protein